MNHVGTDLRECHEQRLLDAIVFNAMGELVAWMDKLAQ